MAVVALQQELLNVTAAMRILAYGLAEDAMDDYVRIGRAPAANYSINGHNYTIRYNLADGIYPPWSTFVKTIPHQQENQHKNFATTQELIRKDVERAFRVLQSRFAIVRGPFRFWNPITLKDIMIACIILHNMIVEDERGVHMPNNNYEVFEENADLSYEPTIDFVQFLQNHQCIRNRKVHSQLQANLIEHLWQYQGTH
ncbi:hypothetical protein L1049_008290 [Liquidambar formosana]|uniref:Nuclease HARBI1 n=1 Tax=Liquidambar formosana TaxID=63359 RepID=A0AAP0X931_LIQFO